MRLVSRHILPTCAAALFLAPLLLMVVGSLRPLGLPPPQGLEIVPADPTLAAYPQLLALLPVLTYLRNSLIVVLVAVPLTVLVASLTGYAIRMLAPRPRKAVVIASIVVLLVPVSALWATRFELYRLAGVLDTPVPLIAPALLATTPFYALVYAWSFFGVSDSQLAAARLEGATHWRIWRTLALPQVRPATLAVGVLAFTTHWANFLDALLYLRSQEQYTLPLGLRTLQLLNPTEFPLLMAGAVVFTLPCVAIFLCAQRLFTDDPLRAVRGPAG